MAKEFLESCAFRERRRAQRDIRYVESHKRTYSQALMELVGLCSSIFSVGGFP